MKKMILVVGIGLSAVILSCGLEGRTNQFTAEKVMVATLLATPEVSFNPVALFGFDGGSVPRDAGMDPDAGTATVGPQAIAFMYFGQRSHQSLDMPPAPITKANSWVVLRDGGIVALESRNDGTYLETTDGKPALRYESGGTYQFSASFDGQGYLGEVQDAPLLERIDVFHPSTGYISHPSGGAFTFTRPPPPAGIERPMGFVTVLPLEGGAPGSPTYTNIPTTPLEFLKLVALPSAWKGNTVTVPGTAFPSAQQTYLVVFQAAKLGAAKTDNLFIGSAILAGTADFAIVRTR